MITDVEPVTLLELKPEMEEIFCFWLFLTAFSNLSVLPLK